MARRLCQLLFTLALLYASAVGVYAWLGYTGARPDVLTIVGDLHGWVRSRLEPATPPAAPPGSLPPPNPSPPPSAPAEASISPTPPPADDPRSKALGEVRDVLLPEAKAIIARMDDPGADVATLKVDARVVLVKARDLLGALLDQKADDRDAQREYKRVADLLIAVDKR